MRYLVLLLLLTVACGAAPTPTPVAPLTFTGTGTTDSARFVLPAGDYTVTWETTGTGCVLAGTLFEQGSTVPRDFGLTGPPPQRFNGVDAGSYYVSIASACPWSVTLSPVH